MSDPQNAPAHSGKPEHDREQSYSQRHSYAQALADAAAAAAQLGVALAHFNNMVNALAAVTPKCECGWAQGHRGTHQRRKQA